MSGVPGPLKTWGHLCFYAFFENQRKSSFLTDLDAVLIMKNLYQLISEQFKDILLDRHTKP